MLPGEHLSPSLPDGCRCGRTGERDGLGEAGRPADLKVGMVYG